MWYMQSDAVSATNSTLEKQKTAWKADLSNTYIMPAKGTGLQCYIHILMNMMSRT